MSAYKGLSTAYAPNPRERLAGAAAVSDCLLFALLILLTVLVIPCLAEAPAPEEPVESVHTESLIAQSRAMERQLRHQEMVYENAEVTEYLTEILKKIADPDEIERHNLKVLVLKSRVVNAFAAPDGVIYITTGLLSRVISEFQIAAILAHELGHIVMDHTARNLLTQKENARREALHRLSRLRLRTEPRRNTPRRRSANSRRSQRAAANAQIPPQRPQQRAEYASFLRGGIGLANDVFLETVHNYLSEFEREADSVGIARLNAAGYLKDGNIAAADSAERGDSVDTAYLSVKLWNVILYETSFFQSAGIFDLVEEQLERLLSIDECDPAALVMRGDMERLMAPRSTASFEWYERALRCDPDNYGALLSLGLAHHAVGNNDRARELLTRYSKLAASEINDIDLVKEIIRRCE